MSLALVRVSSPGSTHNGTADRETASLSGAVATVWANDTVAAGMDAGRSGPTSLTAASDVARHAGSTCSA